MAAPWFTHTHTHTPSSAIHTSTDGCALVYSHTHTHTRQPYITAPMAAPWFTLSLSLSHVLVSHTYHLHASTHALTLPPSLMRTHTRTAHCARYLPSTVDRQHYTRNLPSIEDRQHQTYKPPSLIPINNITSRTISNQQYKPPLPLLLSRFPAAT